MTEIDDRLALIKRAKSVTAAVRRSKEGIKAAADHIEIELVRFDGENAPIDFSVDLAHETIWATQQQMAELFGKERPTIGEHIKAVFDDGEAERVSTSRNFRLVRLEGGRTVARDVEHYNLDVILAVGYRVHSPQAAKFRKWATGVLRSYLVSGFALNEKRLRSDPDALNELAARVRAMRADEANLYRAVRDVFAFATTDYDKDSPVARSFFALVQDKFVYAITDKSSGEVILSRCDRQSPNLGLVTMKGRKPTKADATVGKNYLLLEELYALHILCEQFLLFVESKAIRGQKLAMRDLAAKFDDLLRLQGHAILNYDGFLATRARDHALREYAAYLERNKLLQAAA